MYAASGPTKSQDLTCLLAGTSHLWRIGKRLPDSNEEEITSHHAVCNSGHHHHHHHHCRRHGLHDFVFISLPSPAPKPPPSAKNFLCSFIWTKPLIPLKLKLKIYPKASYEGSEGKKMYSCTHSLTSALDVVGGWGTVLQPWRSWFR